MHNKNSESKKVALIFIMDVGFCNFSAISKVKCRIRALMGCTIGGEDMLGNMVLYLLLDSERTGAPLDNHL